MAAEGLWRGPSAGQDVRFSDKEMKQLRTQRFAKIFDKPVDMKKVKKEVIYPWIARRVTELLGVEDEVLINFIFSLLQEDKVEPKRMQIQLTGFLENHTTTFMKELWKILRNAHRNEHGIPQKLLDDFAEENGLNPTEVEDARKKAVEAAARLSSNLLEDSRKQHTMEEGTEMLTSPTAVSHSSKKHFRSTNCEGRQGDGSPAGRREDEKRRRLQNNHGHRHVHRDRFRQFPIRHNNSTHLRRQSPRRFNSPRRDGKSGTWGPGRSFRNGNVNQRHSDVRGKEAAFPPGLNCLQRGGHALSKLSVPHEPELTFPPGFERKSVAGSPGMQIRSPMSPPPGFEYKKARLLPNSPLKPRSFRSLSSPQRRCRALPGIQQCSRDDAMYVEQFQSTGNTAEATRSDATGVAETDQHAAQEETELASEGLVPAVEASQSPIESAALPLPAFNSTAEVLVPGVADALCQSLLAEVSGSDKHDHEESQDQQESSHPAEDMDISSDDESPLKRIALDNEAAAEDSEDVPQTKEEREAQRQEKRRRKEEKRARKEDRRKRREEKRLRKEEKRAARKSSKRTDTADHFPDDWVPLTVMEADVLKQDAEIHICSQDFEERDKRWIDSLILDGPAADSLPEHGEYAEWSSMPKLAAVGNIHEASQEHHKTITADEQSKAELERGLRMKAMQSLQARRLVAGEAPGKQ